MPLSKTRKNWDIFCQVIDNYGDIGVCWRLARQLANEYSINVRLWVDEIDALCKIRPDAIRQEWQILDKVEVCIWSMDFQPTAIADVVIEAFACELPATYLQAMAEIARSKSAPVWINLEYLSAESWVDDCHQLNSFHQPTGLNKTFYFPGFSDKTGGLLRESGLINERDEFVKNRDAQNQLLLKLGLKHRPGGWLVSLFCYENKALRSLLNSWQNSATPVTCIVPAGKTLTCVNHCLEQALSVGQSLQLGNLLLVAIPFLNQTEYDQLLWLCDVNFVRGEDSFVRAQWAAKPMVWHIYPQTDAAHLIKLQAFVERYLEQAETPLDDSIRALWQAWNKGENITAYWEQLIDIYPLWLAFSRKWCQGLACKRGLADNLVKYSSKNNSQ